MGTVQIVGYIIESIIVIAGILSTYLVLRRDRKYLGNIMMASTTGAITSYILCITIYDIFLPITLNDGLVYFFLPLALFSIVSAGLFMFLTMKIMTNGTYWVKDFKKTLWYIIPVLIFGIVIFIMRKDIITINDYVDVDTHTSIYVMIVLALFLLFFLISSIILVSKYGIKKSEGKSKKKMIRYRAALFIMLFALIFNLLKMFNPNEALSPILDMVYFGIVGLGAVAFAYSFADI